MFPMPLKLLKILTNVLEDIGNDPFTITNIKPQAEVKWERGRTAQTVIKREAYIFEKQE